MRTLAALLLLSTACTSKPAETTPDAAAVTPKKKIDPASTSSVSGTVRYGGALPEPTTINASGDGACVAARPGTFDSGDVRVKEGKVENAFVWISSGLEEYGFDTPTKEIVIDQRGCMYQPRVLGAQTGQPLVFLNSDQTIHNIKASPKNSKGFNFATPPNGRGAPKAIAKQEVMVKLGCDVHPWMTAWLGVVDHPYFALTDAEGRFSLSGVPKGSYTISAWHERLGSVESKITVEGPAVELTLPGGR